MISNVKRLIGYSIASLRNRQVCNAYRIMSHKRGPRRSFLFLTPGLAILLVLLLFSLPAQAQSRGGFIIQPMIVDVGVRPGPNQFDLILQNHEGRDPQDVKLKIVELTQDLDGSWSIQDSLANATGNSSFDISKHNSCKEWLEIDSRDTRVHLNPFESKPVTVDVRVPGGKRGFYCAGILATLMPKPGSTGVRVKYEFVVPILLKIEGAVLFNRVGLADANMELREKTKELPEASLVSFEVRNTGETQAAVQVSGQLRAFAEGRWKNISKFDFAPRRIIPGACLKFERDYGKSLPSGRYKLSAVAIVNNQRTRGIEKTIDYVGPKSAAALTEAVAIEFDPELLQIDCAPRIRRSGKTMIYNNSNEPVIVKLRIETPTHMQNTTYLGNRCDMLSCPDWLTVQPTEISLKPFQERAVRVMAQMPEEDQLFANYYADLVVDCFYENGSTAGQVRGALCVNNKDVVHDPAFREIGEELEQFGASRYVVKAAFFNEGDTHIDPEVNVRVMDPTGVSLKNVPMHPNANLSTLMLPFAKRTFFAELDFSDVPPGSYFIRIDYNFDGIGRPGQITKQVTVRLVGQEQRLVEGFTDATL